MVWLWVAAAVGGLLVLVGLMAAIGARLPRAHTVTVRATHRQTPGAIWAAISNRTEAANWRSDLKSIELLPEEDGQAVWVEHGRNGNIKMRAERAEPGERLVVRIADPKLPFGGSWTYVLEPADGGCILHITEDGEVYNPLYRFLSHTVFGPWGTLERYQRDLGRKFGDDVATVRVR